MLLGGRWQPLLQHAGLGEGSQGCRLARSPSQVEAETPKQKDMEASGEGSHSCCCARSPRPMVKRRAFAGHGEGAESHLEVAISSVLEALQAAAQEGVNDHEFGAAATGFLENAIRLGRTEGMG